MPDELKMHGHDASNRFRTLAMADTKVCFSILSLTPCDNVYCLLAAGRYRVCLWWVSQRRHENKNSIEIDRGKRICGHVFESFVIFPGHSLRVALMACTGCSA